MNDPEDATGRWRLARPSPMISGRRTVVPGPGLPDGLRVLASNNNLDLTLHEGRLFFAWRTAPVHFAHRDAAIHVVVSDDLGRTWSHETTLAFGRDVREPRFVEWDGRLLLYCFTAGIEGHRFEPDRVQLSVREPDGRWREPIPVSEPDTVVWRVRSLGGRLVMSVYRFASTLYTTHPQQLSVELWTSDDGREWGPLDPEHPVSHVGGAEAEFLPLGDGTIVVTVRKEGPDGGWGSDICVSDPGFPARWTRRRSSFRKLDSPLLFESLGRQYLIARRAPWFGGRYDLGLPWGSRLTRTRLYQGIYWATPKRSTLWAVDPEALAVTPLADLGGVGDTSFGAQVPLGGGRHLVFDYSSDPFPRWRPWVVGQLRPTQIYGVEVDLTQTDVATRPSSIR
jgi:hypothetical protein